MELLEHRIKETFLSQETRKGIREEITLELMNKGWVEGHQTKTAAKRLPGRGNYMHYDPVWCDALEARRLKHREWGECFQMRLQWQGSDLAGPYCLQKWLVVITEGLIDVCLKDTLVVGKVASVAINLRVWVRLVAMEREVDGVKNYSRSKINRTCWARMRKKDKSQGQLLGF